MTSKQKIIIGVGVTAVALYFIYDSMKGNFANISGKKLKKKKKKKKKNKEVIEKTPKNNCPEGTNIKRAKDECKNRKGTWNKERCACEQKTQDPRTQPPPNLPNINQGIVQGITRARITNVWNPSTNPNLGCFVAGTSISMADGTSKNIEDVKVGDKIFTWNEKDAVKEISQVSNEINLTKDDIYEVVFADASMSVFTTKFNCTAEHPVLIKDKGWVSAEDLKEGDLAQDINANPMVVKSVKLISTEATKVYNLSVEGNHNYYANKILVHNKETAEGQTYTGAEAIAVFTAIQNAYNEFMQGEGSQGDSSTMGIAPSESRISQTLKEI